MNRHLLLALGFDRSAFNGVRFVGSFFTSKDDLEITLYATAALPAVDEFAPHKERAQGEQLSKQRAEKAAETLAKARDLLRLQGCAQAMIHDRFSFRAASAAKDIVTEGERGLYDAVVLGRRGLTWFEELVESSVSREVLDREISFPLWICRHPEPERRNVLLCVDDSEPALRVADHVGFMLAAEPGHDVTLLNVYDPGSEDRMFAEEVFARCRAVIAANGVDPCRVSARVVESYNPARTILRMAEAGRYAVVAAGRTGEDQGFLKRMFMGSVSGELYAKLTGAVLWLSR